MNTKPITSATLAASVISVPPLARNADGSFNREENRKLIRHLEGGGVSTLLYGGNAILAHISISEYAEMLAMLTELSGEKSLVIPSVGPGFGMMMDQAKILRDFAFPTAMMLPSRDVVTSDGVASAAAAIRRSDATAGGALHQERRLHRDRRRAAAGERWPAVVDQVRDGARQSRQRPIPAAVGGCGWSVADRQRHRRATGGSHLREFGLAGYTSGCVCVAPRLSMQMLRAIKAGDFSTAERIQSIFRPLEDLRNAINPIRVLHTAVSLAGIAEMGPIIPLLAEVNAADRPAIKDAATKLLHQN